MADVEAITPARCAATTERIVFGGNCQIAQLCGVYREITGAEAHYVPAYEATTKEDRAAMDCADRFVWQITDMDQRVALPDDSRPRHLVPVVSGQFLFPLSGEAHVQNRDYPFMQGGPYPAEMGDTTLNAAIRSGTPVDTAISRYFTADVAGRKKTRRMMEITLDRQAQRDRRAGAYRCADIIDACVQNEPLFLTRGHLHAPLLRHLAECLFAEMDLPQVDALASVNYMRYVPPSELPIHPGIRAALDLRFRVRDYAFNYEGRFSAEEWAERYLRFAWSRNLSEGIWLFHQGRVAASIPLLARGLIECPHSEVGRITLDAACGAITDKH